MARHLRRHIRTEIGTASENGTRSRDRLGILLHRACMPQPIAEVIWVAGIEDVDGVRSVQTVVGVARGVGKAGTE